MVDGGGKRRSQLMVRASIEVTRQMEKMVGCSFEVGSRVQSGKEGRAAGDVEEGREGRKEHLSSHFLPSSLAR